MYQDSQFKILLVEDNPGDVLLVEMFLRDSELKKSVIVNEKTLKEAIETLNGTAFDVVLLDLNLLDSNGFETIEKLFAAHPKSNVIVFTGMEDTDFGIRALQAGAQDYLVKGNFGADYLVKTLRYAIERNQINQQLKNANKLRERYNSIFSQSKDAIFVIQENGKFVEFNQATLDIFGYTEEELRNIDTEFLYPKGNAIKSIVDTINERGFVQNFPIDIRRKDSSIRPCLITANFLKIEGGEKEYHGIIRDITIEIDAVVSHIQKAIAEQRDRFSMFKDTVFISYSRKDFNWLKQMQTYFKPLEDDVDFWDDTKIRPGQVWKEEVEKALSRAKIGILMLSTDFFNSDFVLKNELPPLLEAAKEKGTVILSIVLRPCRFNSYPEISKYQFVSSPDKALSQMEESEIELVFIKLIDTIETILKTKSKT